MFSLFSEEVFNLDRDEPVIRRITNSGVNIGSLSVKFNDKLVTRNKFSLLCILFSALYLFYFVVIGQVIPFFLLLAGIFLFAGSIALNRYGQFKWSATLVLISTNYCVLFTSLFFGFESGFHLYFLISPLIVFVLFSKEDGLFFKLAISSYVLNFILVVVIGKISDFKVVQLTDTGNDIVYLFNFLFAIILLIVLLLYFSYNNAKINAELEEKNVMLTDRKNELTKENLMRQSSELKLVQSLKEKDILLAEVHHRVKNNLAVVSAFLELERNGTSKKAEKDIIRISQNRIKAIALLHELLYESESIEMVNMKEYLNQLIKYLQLNYANQRVKVNFHVLCDVVLLKFNRSIPFALIINELISQSFAALTEKDDELNIHIHIETTGKQVVFFYKDFVTDFKMKVDKNKESCSLSLVELLTSQLNADYEILNKNGKIFKLQFKNEL